jgi:hypothetical protein
MVNPIFVRPSQTNSEEIEQVGSNGNAYDFYLEGARFESYPEYRQS